MACKITSHADDVGSTRIWSGCPMLLDLIGHQTIICIKHGRGSRECFKNYTIALCLIVDRSGASLCCYQTVPKGLNFLLKIWEQDNGNSCPKTFEKASLQIEN
jgi:hypothetical protein